jgi:hypothetical protein
MALSAHEIHERYYPTISDSDFNAIVVADTLSSNLQRDKVGKYAKWILNLYLKGRFSMQMLDAAIRGLAVFDRISKANILENKDIFQYKSIASMLTAVSPYRDTQIISKSEYERQKKEREADKLYEDNQFLVINPKSKWAAATYGKDTKWCTATNQYSTDYYEQYTLKGKLYIIIDKKNDKKFQFHFETGTYCDAKDDVIAYNSLNSMKKLKLSKELIEFFMEERKNSYLWEDTSDKINIAEKAEGSNNTIYIGIHKKKFGIIHGSKGWNILIPFDFDLIKKQEIFPAFYETYLNGETDLCYFVNNELFYNILWYSANKKKFSEYNMHCPENLLFPYYIPSCKNELDKIIKGLELNFDKNFNKTFLKNKRKKSVKRRFVPNCIAANKLTMAILEYAYNDLSNNKTEREIIQNCRNRVNEFDNNSIPKIIDTLEINKSNFYLVIENKLKDGVFRLRYSNFLELPNKYNEKYSKKE